MKRCAHDAGVIGCARQALRKTSLAEIDHSLRRGRQRIGIGGGETPRTGVHIALDCHLKIQQTEFRIARYVLRFDLHDHTGIGPERTARSIRHAI